MSTPRDTWRPTATRTLLQQRAAALECVREFFRQRAVMEVDTPVVVNAAVTDVHIHSAEVRFPDDKDAPAGAPRFFLHTSPEFAMKRLLAAGSGDIFQICHVARGLERGRQHNAEFTLIEWYRVGFSLDQLMDEVEGLVRAVLGGRAKDMRAERIAYRDAFVRELQLDPFTATREDLERAARAVGFHPADAQTELTPSMCDELLDLLMSAKIGPQLGRDALTFVHRYPASQAALARLDPADARCALRFELYGEGLELANGFHELASHHEQRTRFEQDLQQRQQRGLPTNAMDERLLAALESGLPDCAGVALGFDRLLMLATDARQIDDVLPFPIERA